MGNKATRRQRRKPGRPTQFEIRVRDEGRAGNLRELGKLYWQARNREDKAYTCAVTGMEIAAQRRDRRLAEAFIRRARQHAIDEFGTLCYLLIVEDVIERLLSDPIFRARHNLP